MDAVLAANDVTFAYPGHEPSLEDVSFEVRAGERLALLGANGSGKSTLLYLLDGLYFATRGAVTAFGETLTEACLEHPPFGPRFRREVGFLFQNSEAQLFSASVEEELAFGPLQLGWPKDVLRDRLDDTCALFGIEALRTRRPHHLSGGERKRVALASLMIVGPSILLLDEPTAGLDPRSQSLLLDILESLHESGLTLVTATHDLHLLPHLADRALVLDESHRLVADRSADDVLSDVALLTSTNLVHSHRHRHGGSTHSHAHLHGLGHGHDHTA
jgi:cobalt/nickel transport system ATP-binding protein